jgi:predicted SAM-dependent methyltransferase
MLRPFSENIADSIYACHVFEHISYRRQLAVLRRWLEILKPGGRLLLSVPDFDKLANIYMRSDCEVRSIESHLMGGLPIPTKSPRHSDLMAPGIPR